MTIRWVNPSSPEWPKKLPAIRHRLAPTYHTTQSTPYHAKHPLPCKASLSITYNTQPYSAIQLLHLAAPYSQINTPKLYSSLYKHKQWFLTSHSNSSQPFTFKGNEEKLKTDGWTVLYRGEVNTCLEYNSQNKTKSLNAWTKSWKWPKARWLWSLQLAAN